MRAPTDDLRFSLRFLSGKHQGSEYVLDDPTTITVGRSSESDLMLIEGMVSREHAKFELASGKLTITDIGSTNGTFVNGERVRSRQLDEGDRVLIGTTILKVVFSRLPVGTKPPPPPSSRDLDDIQTQDRDKMAGSLEEVGVPELLEMFGSSRQRLILELESGGEVANITIADGRVLDCKNRKLQKAPALKCVLRTLGYTRGSFSVRTFRAPKKPYPLDIPIPELLVDGLFKLDELQVLRQRLPDGGELVLAKPLVASLSALEERDLDTLQLAHNHGGVNEVLDNSTETDLDAAKRLLTLIDGGYLRRA
jgi:pSer/pThr/pTyr-binding forkhead associated (FHA) protein